MSDGHRLHLATLEAQVDVMVTDTLRLELARGVEREGRLVDVVSATHVDFPRLDRECVVPASPGSDREAALAALGVLVEQGLSGRVVESGLLGTEEVAALVDAAQARRAAHRADVVRQSLADDASRPSALLAVARELGLDPQPDGVAVGQWRGRCPGRPHHLMLSATAEAFGCGWCAVKGGPTELRALVGRRSRRPDDPRPEVLP